MGFKNAGVLWKRANKQGQEYLSGSIDLGVMGDAKIMVFTNDKKTDEKQPDYRISLVTDTDEAVK